MGAHPANAGSTEFFEVCVIYPRGRLSQELPGVTARRYSSWSRGTCVATPSKQLWPRPVLFGSPGHQSRYGDHEGDPGNADDNLHSEGAGKFGQDYEAHKR